MAVAGIGPKGQIIVGRVVPASGLAPQLSEVLRGVRDLQRQLVEERERRKRAEAELERLKRRKG